MPFSSSRFTRLSLLGLFLFLSGIAMAPPSVMEESAYLEYPAQKVGPFQVTFSWLTPRVQVSEPVWFRLSYLNTSTTQKHRFQISWSFHGDLRAYVRYPRHAPIRVLGAFDETIPFSATFEVEPGETHSLEDFILYIPEAMTGLATENPGELRVAFQIRCTAASFEEKILEYPDLPVTILAPVEETQKVLTHLDSLPDLESGRRLIQYLQGLTATDAIAPMMIELAESAPHSALAPLALYCLGAYSSTKGRLEDQVRYYRELQQRFPHHPLADDALWLVARGLRNLGDADQAQAVVIRLARLYPESNRLRLVDEFYNAIAVPLLRPAHPGVWMLFDPRVAPTTAEWDELMKERSKPLVVFDSMADENAAAVPAAGASIRAPGPSR